MGAPLIIGTICRLAIGCGSSEGLCIRVSEVFDGAWGIGLTSRRTSFATPSDLSGVGEAFVVAVRERKRTMQSAK